MRLSRTGSGLAAMCAALALAACGGSEPADTADSGAAPAADSAETAAAPAPATGAPSNIEEGPAPGNWRMTMTVAGQTMPPVEYCYEKQVSFAEAQEMQQQAGVTCSENSYKRQGDAVVGHAVCTMDAGGQTMKMTTDTRITGDFKSKYTMDMTSKIEPAPMPGMEEQKMTMTAERIGDC